MTPFKSFTVKVIASLCKNQVGLSPLVGGIESQFPRIYCEVSGSAESPEFELPSAPEALSCSPLVEPSRECEVPLVLESMVSILSVLWNGFNLDLFMVFERLNVTAEG